MRAKYVGITGKLGKTNERSLAQDKRLIDITGNECNQSHSSSFWITEVVIVETTCICTHQGTPNLKFWCKWWKY